MGRLAVVLAFVLAAPLAGAQTPAGPAGPAGDVEDDPAFARQPQPPAVPVSVPVPVPVPVQVEDEPVPDPIPYVEEDPGFSPAAPTAAPSTSLAARTRRRAPPPDDSIGIGVRFAYKTVAIPEPSAPPAGGTEPPFEDDRFHGLCLDVYPIAWYARIGLSTQVAFEPRQNDWFATEGLVLGLQRPTGRFTPFVEGGAHVGLIRRTFYLFDERIPAQTSPTILWAFHGEVGVDARFGRGSVAATVAVGLQRSSFFYTTGIDPDKLLVKDDTAVTLKVGLGY